MHFYRLELLRKVLFRFVCKLPWEWNTWLVKGSSTEIWLQGTACEFCSTTLFSAFLLPVYFSRIDQHDQIKVGDFGLSEDIYAKNYFRQTSSGGVKLPVKWMALESLKLGVFSEKSDVVSPPTQILKQKQL